MGGRAAHVPDAVTRTNSNEYWETRVNVVIHHNPECGTSRNVLSIIESAGFEPTIIEYLKTGWTKPQLLGLFAAAGLTPRSALRIKKSPAEQLGLLEATVADEAIITAMLEHPILVNRPIVCTNKGVRLCRPSETVLDLLDRIPPGPLYKENGELIIDMQGKRII
jgi:arsenate reductase